MSSGQDNEPDAKGASFGPLTSSDDKHHEKEMQLSIEEWLERYVKPKVGQFEGGDKQYKGTEAIISEHQDSARRGQLETADCVEAAERLRKTIKKFFPKGVPMQEQPEWLQAVVGLTPRANRGIYSSVRVAEVDFASAISTLSGEEINLHEVFEQAVEECLNRLLLPRVVRNQGRVNRDFQRDFTGASHHHLHARLQRMNRLASTDPSVYARVLPIIQSSGTGKTRTALELSTLELGFYTCIREPSGDNAVSAPNQDPLAYEYLSKKPSEKLRELNPIVAVASWLVGFFRAYKDLCLVERQKLGDGCSRAQLISHMASLLRRDIVPGFSTGSPTSSPGGSRKGVKAKSPRDDLLENIAIQAAKFLADESAGVVQEWELRRKSNPHMEEFFVRKLHQEFGSLNGLFPEQLERDNHYIHLVVDEAKSMGSNVVHLRRLLSYMKESNFWVLLVDTNNRVSELSGYFAPKGKARPMTGGYRLIGPFVEMPQDIFLRSRDHLNYYRSILFGSRRVEHREVLQLLPKMGRPLWNDNSWQTGSVSDIFYGRNLRGIFEKLVNNATKQFTAVVEKVNIGTNLDDATRTRYYSILLAAASQRLPLQLAGVQNTDTSDISFSEEQVANHLRIVTWVESCGTLISTFNPSEPILSLAVANQFREAPTETWSAVLVATWNRMLVKELHIGVNGEEFYRVIMSVAMDSALKRPPQKPSLPGNDLPDHLWVVSVYDWLVQLLGTNAEHPSIKAWSQHRWINFTHFGKLTRQDTEERPMSRHLLAQMWTRQIAFLGIGEQAKWDILIVCLESKEKPTAQDILKVEDLCPITIRVNLRGAHYRSREDKLAELGRSTYPSDAMPCGFLNIYASLTPASTAFEVSHKAAPSPPDTLCLYIGGSSNKSYSVLDRLGQEAQNILQMFLGKHGDPEYADEPASDAKYFQQVFKDHGTYTEPLQGDIKPQGADIDRSRPDDPSTASKHNKRQKTE